MPFRNPPALNVVAGDPVEKLARLLAPEADPASIWNALTTQPLVGACQFNATPLPETVAARPLGGFGEPTHPFTPTVTTISFDGLLVPLELRARTRTK